MQAYGLVRSRLCQCVFASKYKGILAASNINDLRPAFCGTSTSCSCAESAASPRSPACLAGRPPWSARDDRIVETLAQEIYDYIPKEALEDVDGGVGWLRDRIDDEVNGGTKTYSNRFDYGALLRSRYDEAEVEASGYNDLSLEAQDAVASIIEEDAFANERALEGMSDDEVVQWLNEWAEAADARAEEAAGAPAEGTAEGVRDDRQVDEGEEERRAPAAGGSTPAAADSAAGGLTLTGQTNDQILAAEKQAQDAKNAQASAEKQAEAKDKADRERDSFSLTGSDRAADANQGQGGLFDAKPMAAEKPSPEKSKGHVEFIGNFEYYFRGGDLHRASISDVVMPDGYRSGRFEATKAASETILKHARGDAASEPAAKSTATAVEDVGENLKANRRNFATGISWDEIKGQNDALKKASVVKAKVWPRPDYEAMVAGGMEPLAARVVKQVYDGIANEPQRADDATLERYIAAVNKVREGLKAWAADTAAVKAFVESAAASAAQRLRNPFGGKPMDSRLFIERIWPGTPTGIMAFRSSEAAKDMWAIGGNRFLRSLQVDLGDVMKAMKDLEAGWPAAQEAWQKQGYVVLAPGEFTVSSEPARRYNRETSVAEETGDVTWTVRKNNATGRASWSVTIPAEAPAPVTKDDHVLINKTGFGFHAASTSEAAIEKARELVGKQRERRGEDIRGTNVADSERTGPERRVAGENVSSQHLMDTFGFRGVNFGRKGWIKDAERQAYVNAAFDGLHDLAELLGVPPKALSLNGMLGIAFGAQGRGGSAAAHFVPGVNEINLTRTMGAGTLAHEWGHALDHYFATMAGLGREESAFLSAHATLSPTRKAYSAEEKRSVELQRFAPDLRPEVLGAFKAVVEAMSKRVASPMEIAQRRKQSSDIALASLNHWLAAIRRNIAPKDEQATRFDALAERIRAGDIEEYVRSGNLSLPQVIAELREVTKSVRGRYEIADNINGLKNAALSRKFDLERKDAAEEHVPQVSTDYLRGSMAKDNEKKGKKYWATPWEMFARAFELYVADRITERGNTNTFLSDAQQRAAQTEEVPDTSSAHSRAAGLTKSVFTNPYPRGVDREATNAAFAALLDAIQTRETDRGVEFYSLDRRGASSNEDNEQKSAYNAAEREAEANGYAREAIPEDRGSDRPAAPQVAGEAEAGTRSPEPPFVTWQKIGTLQVGLNRVTSPEDAAAIFADLRRYPREKFTILMTDAKGKPLGVSHIFAGTIAATTVYPREVALLAYATPGAKRVWFAHNHPSGTTAASQADERLTQTLSLSFGADLGITVEGHIIVAGNRASMLDKNGYTIDSNLSPTVTAGSKYKIPVVERIMARELFPGRALAGSPLAAAQIVKGSLGDAPGIVWLDYKREFIAADPMPPAEMGSLRSPGVFRRLMQRVSEMNPGAVLLQVANRGQMDLAANIANALNLHEIRVMDVFYPDPTTGALVSYGGRPDSPRGAIDFNALDRADEDFARTERAYGGREAYDKAKAAGKTKLNYRQWVQVRTPAFKRWFGDWGASKARGLITAMDAIPIEQRSTTDDVLRAAADAAYSIAIAGGPVAMRDGRAVTLTPVGLKKTRSHSADRRVLDLLTNIRSVLEASHHIASVPHERAAPGDSIRAWHYYGAKVKMGGAALYAKLVVRESVNGQIYYDNDLSSVEEIGGRGSDATPAKPEAVPVSADRPTLAQMLGPDNGDGVSKVIDPETGEPALAYHGTARDFSAFDPAHATKGSMHPTATAGHFFSADPSIASGFSGEVWEGWPLKKSIKPGAHVMSTFLAISNPKEIAAREFMQRFVRHRFYGDKGETFESWARSGGYDGVLIKGDPALARAMGGEEYGADTWVAFKPGQIKSATGNNGAFDPANPSILAALDRGPLNRIERALDAGDADAVRAEIIRAMAEKKRQAGPSRGVISARKAILDARRAGTMDKATADLTLWLLAKAPHLANDAVVVIPQDGREGMAGSYKPVERLITLVAGRGDESVGVHEFMHHAERMMPEAVQKGIREEWARQLSDLQSWGQSVNAGAVRRAVAAIVRMNAGDRAAQQEFNRMILDGVLPGSAYAMANPSEFWAENAARILSDRAYAEQHGWVAEARQWLRELVEKIKDIIGLPSDAAVLRALREVINGKGDALSSTMLLEDADATGMRRTRDRVFPKIEFDAIEKPLGRMLDNVHLPSATEARNALASATKASRPVMLGALTRRQIAEVYGRDAPELSQYDQAMQAMEAEYQRSARASDVVLRQWTKLKPAIADRMAEVMHAATLADYDPAKMVGELAPAGPLRALQAQYDSMPDDAKAVYVAARDHYQLMLDDRFDALRQRILRSEASPQAKTSAIDQLAALYDQAKQGVYFPLARFGDHLVLATKKNAEGKETDRQMSAFESAFKADAAARQLRAGGWTVKQMRAKEYSRDQQGAASKIVADMMTAIDGLNFGEGENSLGEGVGSAKDQLLDALNQSFIGSLPDLSYRKHFTHRKGVAGFSRDAMRAFADSAFHAAHNISRLRHGDTLSFALMGLDKRIREQDDGDTTVMGDTYNEMVKRHAIYMNPNTSPVAAWLGQLGFVMSLGGSVATGVTNMTQVPLITLPWLGARHGMGKATTALVRAYKDFADPATLNAETVFNAANSKRLTDGERAMLQSLIDDGVIDVTQALDLAQLSSTDATSRFAKEYGGVKDRVMRALAFTFHVPEVANRQVTALAAYRLAIGAGKTDAEARMFAKESVWGTHFDYSSSNRARYMTGNVMRVLTMFKQYSQNVLYLYGRALRVWLDRNNATPEERRVARKQFLTMLGFQFAAAGALGMPILGSVASIFAAALQGLGGGDDDWDWEVEFRKWLAEAIGKDAAEVASHGLSRLTPWDMAGRLGQNDLFIRAPSREREGRAAFLDWLTAAGGPVAGYAQNAYLGVGDIMTGIHQGSGGHLLRGAEELTPAFARNAIRAMRFQIEGGVLTRDQTKQLELTAPEKFGQLFGFGPARSAEMYEGVTAIKNAETRLNQRRQGLLDSYARALKEHDEHGLADLRREIVAFNQQHPRVAITAQSMRASIFMRAKREREMKDGVWLSKSRDHLRAEGAFANMH